MADRFLRSGNPGLNDKTFASQPLVGSGERMTVQGAVNKSFLLLVVLLAGAFWPWSQYLATGDASTVVPAMWIAIQAVGATFAVFAAMLLAYKTGLIRVTERFRAVVLGATLAIGLFYLVTMGLSLFHVSLGGMFNGSALGIGI